MNPVKVLAIVLIVAGILGLVYGKFSYPASKHEAKVGPLEFSVQEKKTVDVPTWAGIGAIVVGALLLVTAKRS